jgi:hypothetical protein
MSQLGRIGGQVLTDNLLRAGVDLAFETDLLYLDVTNNRIGVRDGTPVYDLDVNSHIKTTNLTVTSLATIDDITFTSPNTIGSILAPIDIYIAGPTLLHDRLATSSLEFDDNFISSFSNSNIVLDPNGSGTVDIYATTNLTGILGVSGNIVLSGNLRSDGIVNVGDNPLDTVTIAPDLTQHLVPGDNILYDLGSSLKRWSNGYANNVDINTGFTAGNITVATPSSISVASGNISINAAGSSPVTTFTGDIQTSGIKFDGNLIQSFTNQNIRFNPSSAGAINLEANTNVTGNLAVTGNTQMNGNLIFNGIITIGDQTIDTVTVNTDFTQSIIPGDDLTYALGADAADSSPRRWAQIYSPDWTKITTGAWAGSGLIPQSITISDQMTLDGVINKISTIQSNEDILLDPDTGITYVENTKWENNYLTNLADTPITLAGTGKGYLRYNGTNGFVIPFGTDLQRRPTPEVGETRWNSDSDYLECWTGTEWVISTGGGDEVTNPIMYDISNIWGLILG